MDSKYLLSPIVTVRVLQLYYHYCHNLVSGVAFIADHDLFASFYSEVEKQYDELVEYYVAIYGGEELPTVDITTAVAKRLAVHPIQQYSPTDMFLQATFLEAELYKDLSALNDNGNLGIKNMVGDHCQTCDVRRYKINQRLK